MDKIVNDTDLNKFLTIKKTRCFDFLVKTSSRLVKLFYLILIYINTETIAANPAITYITKATRKTARHQIVKNRE